MTVGIDPQLGALARELRLEADALADAAERLSLPQLGAIGAKLAQIPLLLEVGSDRESPEQLRASAESLRGEAIRALAASG